MSDETPDTHVVRVQGFDASGPVTETARVWVTAPREWLVGGYRQALARFDAASRLPADAPPEETFWPLFEALNWATSVEDFFAKETPLDDPMVRAMRFARNRVHHHWAAAVDLRWFDMSGKIDFPGGGTISMSGRAFDWFWRAVAQLPPGRNSKGEAEYVKLLAERPAREALGRFAELADAHD